MIRVSNFKHVNHCIKRFACADDGNIAVMFAIALLPMLAFVGAAIDYTRVNDARTAMQAALDSAALMISKDATTLSATDLTTRAKGYFNSLYNHPEAPATSFSATYVANTGSGATVQLTASGSMPTDIMRIVGFPTLDFDLSSTAAWGTTRLRVALALDNTGSMASANKMDSLKTAANTLIGQLAAKAKADGDLYISIIPFAKDVNIGPASYDASWIDWSDWEAEPQILDPARGGTKPSNWTSFGPGSDCPFSDKSYGFVCMDRPGTDPKARQVSSIPSSADYAGYICPGLDSGRKVSTKTRVYYNGCYTSTKKTGVVSSGSRASCNGYDNCSCSGSNSNKTCTGDYYVHVWRDTTTTPALAAPPHSTWNGCIADRTQDEDTLSDKPVASDPDTLFPAEQWADCPTSLVPLTSVWATNSNGIGILQDKIKDMQPAGNTNQPIGLAWAWLSLLHQDPLNAQDEDPNYQYKKAIVLLSDGDNTQNRTSSNVAAIDARQEILCKNAGKDATIYTIQVNTDGTATSPVMKDCASPDGGFYSTKTSSGIGDAFNDIYNSLSKLRIAR